MRAYPFLLLASTAAIPAHAQQATPQPAAPDPVTEAAPGGESDGDEDMGDDIVVTGSRAQRGAVIGDITPEQQLSPADIRSYGVGSITELLNELTPQTSSGRGSGGGPVVLLNGRRISGFKEIRDIPTEAIQRVDILPEEVALKYGYRADQRVVNFVLRRRFRAVTAEAGDRVATGGGRNAPGADLDILRIRDGGRANLHLEYDRASALTEAERDIRQPADTPDQSRFRTLLPETQTLAANGTYATTVLGDVGATINATVDHSRSDSLRGLSDDGVDVLAQRVTSTDLHLGTTLGGNSGRWLWSLTGNVDRNQSDTVTQTDLASDNTGRSTSTTAGLDALASGPLFALPAGDASTSIRVGASTSDFTSRSVRNAVATAADIGRDIGNAQVNLDLPVASRASGVLSALGNLSLNGNLAVDRLSDFGTLWTIGYGANWSPVEPVRLIVSFTDEDEAPTAAQLGNPSVTTPGVRVFDYVAGTTATVTTVTGGNPLLRSDNRHAAKVGVEVRPWKGKDISLRADYTSQSTDDPVASFPTATAAIESAFPDRFVRDADGQLLRIDSRPINYARTEQSQLRYGINLSFALKSRIQKELEAYRAGTGPNPFQGCARPAAAVAAAGIARATAAGRAPVLAGRVAAAGVSGAAAAARPAGGSSSRSTTRGASPIACWWRTAGRRSIS